MAELNLDEEKIDEAVLALLHLTLHNKFRAWKGHDFDAMYRLYEKGFIDDPVNKNRSVTLTDEGLEKSKALFETMFCK